MKIGAVYPQTELGGDPTAVGRIGKAVEELGYDHLVMYDHVVGAAHDRQPPLWKHGPYTEKHPFHEPFVTFGYLAGITKRIELVTGILILPQRQTVLVAKQAADVDLLSGGRLCLGVGIGWNYVEYDALGQDFSKRGRRLDEQIGFLRKLWEEPLASFAGEFDSIDRAGINPRPTRRIPVYCGGFSDVAFKRAAKLADGYIFGGSLDKGALPGWERVRHYLNDAGRPIDGFGAHYLVQSNAGTGLGVEETVDAIRRWQDAGGTHASVVTMGLELATAARHIDYLADVRRRLDTAQAGFPASVV